MEMPKESAGRVRDAVVCCRRALAHRWSPAQEKCEFALLHVANPRMVPAQAGIGSLLLCSPGCPGEDT
jgi:hypothetical protein